MHNAIEKTRQFRETGKNRRRSMESELVGFGKTPMHARDARRLEGADQAIVEALSVQAPSGDSDLEDAMWEIAPEAHESALESYGEFEDTFDRLGDPQDFCWVCVRATNHVAEHDDLLAQGLARYEGGIVYSVTPYERDLAREAALYPPRKTPVSREVRSAFRQRVGITL